ncbi:MAG: NAD(P)-binding protein [Planctomycetota bacterium]|nr:NAD(P)-binding protein [Planctomycetota bacterium]
MPGPEPQPQLFADLRWPAGWLAERVRALPSAPGADRSARVVCWLHHAVRAEENPALLAARARAAELALPLVIFAGVTARDPFATDRHWWFELQGLRDLALDLPPDLRASLIVEADSDARGFEALAALLAGAELITDDFPLEPWHGWVNEAAAASARAFAVDSACVVPMLLVGRAHDRAFAFRDATARDYAVRVSETWALDLRDLCEPDQPAIQRALAPGCVFAGSQVAAWTDADLSALCARATIDHAVPPVFETSGGARAGLARWAHFRDRHLRSYAQRRNDALDHGPEGGVSRMSAYLHHGHVASQRLAREAHARGGAGAEKYLDELLIWRELAYAFCFYRADARAVRPALSTIPAWARATLAAHERDGRELIDLDTLARAQTGDALWDAAQRSLLIHGELHNNLRMTWGKALLGWTRAAGPCLQHLVDLNHRFALDGRDPASLGGILWCLGQFDRPHPTHTPERAVLGTVRGRPTAEHAQRLDVRAFTSWVGRPRRSGRMPSIAVIGAGIAGLACARTLSDQREHTHVFDKGRGPGGRVSTRRAEIGGLRVSFDHGAPGFDVSAESDPNERFLRLVRAWQEQGLIREDAPGEHRFVAASGMHDLPKLLSQGLTIHSGVKVDRLAREGSQFRLLDDTGADRGVFDRVVLAVPPANVIAICEASNVAPTVLARARAAVMDPCWTVLAVVSGATPVGKIRAPEFAAYRESDKPGRSAVAGHECWTIHASPAWTREHLEREPADVQARLLEVFFAHAGPPSRLIGAQAHRWRYARVASPAGAEFLEDESGAIIACGDWCLGDGVARAYLSGVAAAGALLRQG